MKILTKERDTGVLEVLGIWVFQKSMYFYEALHHRNYNV